MRIMQKIINIIVSLLFLTQGFAAFATTSTINPNVPVANSPLVSSVVRNNFAAAYNDVNALWTAIGSGGVTWPASGSVVISNGTSSPSGVAEVDGNCLKGVAGAWASGSCGAGTVTSSGSPVSGNIPKFTTATNIAPAAATDIVNLFSTCSGTQYLGADGSCHTASGSGTVTSVTFTGDGIVDSSTPSSAVTTSGTVTATILTQSAKTFLAGPTSGSAANPSFRAIANSDEPVFTQAVKTGYSMSNFGGL